MWGTPHTKALYTDHGCEWKISPSSHHLADLPWLWDGPQLPQPWPDFLCSLLAPRWYIGIIPTAHELTRSVWLYHATPSKRRWNFQKLKQPRTENWRSFRTYPPGTSRTWSEWRKWSDKRKRTEALCIFEPLMELCYLKHAELAKHFQKYNGMSKTTADTKQPSQSNRVEADDATVLIREELDLFRCARSICTTLIASWSPLCCLWVALLFVIISEMEVCVGSRPVGRLCDAYAG